ncbi:MAG: hypothetical protein ACI9PU_001177, partial [Ascidiaceihabitans sp.]
HDDIMQNIIGKAVRPIESEAYEILRAIQAYEYKNPISQIPAPRPTSLVS